MTTSPSFECFKITTCAYQKTVFLKRLKEIDDRLIREVRQASGRIGNVSAIEAEIRQLARDVALPSKLNIEENEEAEFWLNLPRTFSFQSSRYLGHPRIKCTP